MREKTSVVQVYQKLRMAGCPSIRTKALSRRTNPGGVLAPLIQPERLRTKTLVDSRCITMRGAYKRPTNHRYGHQQPAMMLPCEHPAYCRMRECSFKVTTWLAITGESRKGSPVTPLMPVRGTPELLSIRAISG